MLLASYTGALHCAKVWTLDNKWQRMVDTADIVKIERKRPPPQPAKLAGIILEGFNRHYALFRYGAQRAKSLFEAGDWHGIQQLSKERIEYYDMRVRECAARLNPILATMSQEADRMPSRRQMLSDEQTRLWQSIKQAFVGLLSDHRQPECAETFFNSVSSRVLHRNYFNNDFLFVRPAMASEYLDSERPVYRVYYPTTDGLKRTLRKVMADFGLACGFEDLPRDARILAGEGCRRLARTLPRNSGHRLAPDCQIHVLGSLFFRNKAAFVIGRLINQGNMHPFAFALIKNPAGQVRIDALLTEEIDLSTLFSFTRAYFLVDMEVPAAYVQFLSTLMPRKPKAELYTMIGLQKQGKTLFYRDFLHHLGYSHDQFDLAPGIPGMVMSVFTLSSYPYVFKLIKDRISKDGMTRETVREKYQMVKLHDRVGRMADTWEYSLVALPRARFSDALIAELQRIAPNQVDVQADSVIFKHLYIERRMTPLNLYLVNAPAHFREQAIRDYGQAIKELAEANIFPGDMLYKNFGVTRFGRVVFDDYDEIQRMTEMNFRKIPPAPNEEAEMAAEPWYSVGPNDVFPEEFATFLLGQPEIRGFFLKYHADLLTAEWWQRSKQRSQHGHVVDCLPYPEERRFEHTVSVR